MSLNANIFARFEAGFDSGAEFLDVPGGRSYTYGDLDAKSARVANALRDLGVGAGDCVSAIADKSTSLLWLYLGCLRAGCIYHPLNPSYTEHEIAFFLRDAGTRLVICDRALEARVRAAAADCTALEHILTLDGEGSFGEHWAPASQAFTSHAAGHADTAALVYSSGTTGTPKGIPLTHGNLYANAETLMRMWAFTRSDVLLHVLPIYHVHGLFVILGPALLAGMQVRFLSSFDVDAVIDALPGASVMAGVPTYYTRLLRHDRFAREACATVRVFISGSAPLSEATFRQFQERTGHAILERYGMSETGILSSNPLSGPRKPGSVGPALDGVALRVVDDAGAIVAAGDVGQIEVLGDNVFNGYRHLPDANREAFRPDRYFRTGDQGYLDGDGYLFIVGRSKDIIITGGLNVYPKEVEREIDALPDVVEAVVFGVPHADFGEATIAAIVLGNGATCDETAMQTALKERLAGYKIPKRIVTLTELPRNAMGKVQKNRLRDQFSELFSGA